MKTILLFSAHWCTACHQLGPILERNNVPHYVIDVDEQRDVANRYDIRSLPTVILLEDEREIGRVVGVSKPNLEKILDFAGIAVP